MDLSDHAKQNDDAHFSETSLTVAPGEVVIGVLREIDASGQIWVTYAESPANKPLLALSTVKLTQQHVGRQLALLFASGDPAKPVIMGLIHSPLNDLLDNFVGTSETSQQQSEPDTPPSAADTSATEFTIEHRDNSDKALSIDGNSVVLEGKEEVVLRCGEASITLTKSGKILIRGNYVSSRSTGVNRILGGSVQVN